MSYKGSDIKDKAVVVDKARLPRSCRALLEATAELRGVLSHRDAGTIRAALGECEKIVAPGDGGQPRM